MWEKMAEIIWRENRDLKSRLEERVEEVVCLRATISTMEKEREKIGPFLQWTQGGRGQQGVAVFALKGNSQEGPGEMADIREAISSIREEMRDLHSSIEGVVGDSGRRTFADRPPLWMKEMRTGCVDAGRTGGPPVHRPEKVPTGLRRVE